MLDSFNPFNGSLVGSVEASSKVTIETFVEKARGALTEYSGLSLSQKKKRMVSFVDTCDQNRDEIVSLIVKETGMLRSTAEDEVSITLEYLRAYVAMSSECLKPKLLDSDGAVQVVYEPWGVIAAIAPWNFPFLNIAFQCGQALLAGNTIVYKTSEENPLFSQMMADLFAESGFPDGVFNVVYGDGTVGEQLARSDVDLISFTGSTETGHTLRMVAAEKMIPFIGEMGGSAPLLIFNDIHIDDTLVEHIFSRRFAKSGQNCDAVKRLIVHENSFDEIVSKLSLLAESSVLGDPANPDTTLGPVVSERILKKLEEQVAEAVAKGAKICAGGMRPEDKEGAFYKATIVTNISTDMKIWKEETFGPVLPVVSFSSEEEAIELANDTVFGLGSHVHTNDHDLFDRVAMQIKSGTVGHNYANIWSPAYPFGGYKKSSVGRTNGDEGFREVTQSKLICKEMSQ